MIKDAIEAWARARGWWGIGRPTKHWTISPRAALVWALVVEAKPLRDGSKCRRCRGRGTWDEWDRRVFYDDVPLHWLDHSGHVFRTDRTDAMRNLRSARAWLIDDGFAVAVVETSTTITGRINCIRLHASRTAPCPDCDGSGLADLTDVFVQHVLDAQPHRYSPEDRRWLFGDNPPLTVKLGGCGAVVSTTHSSGSPQAREALHVLADRLQANGQQLGIFIALLLDGSPEALAELERDGVEELQRLTLWRRMTTQRAESFDAREYANQPASQRRHIP
jgi:hypothetical protein